MLTICKDSKNDYESIGDRCFVRRSLRFTAEIIAQENSTSEELLKKLIYQHWQTLKPRQTLAQRKGGHPENLLQDAAPDASLRENRKQIINARITIR